MANQAYESYGPLTMPRRFKGWKETLDLPDIIVEVTPDTITVTPVDDVGRVQKVLAVTMRRPKSS